MAQQGVFIQEEPRGPSVLVEIPVTTAGQQRIPVPDINELRSTPNRRIILKALKLVTLDVLTNGITNGSANAPLTELKKLSMVVYAEGWEKARYIPLLFMNDVATPAGTFPYRQRTTYFDDWEGVSWDQCYLQFANTTVSAGVPYVVILEVHYIRLNSAGLLIEGPSS